MLHQQVTVRISVTIYVFLLLPQFQTFLLLGSKNRMASAATMLIKHDFVSSNTDITIKLNAKNIYEHGA
jgi:hypothetical protein